MMYHMPTKIQFGIGIFNNLENIVKEYSPHKILLITGKNFMRESGLLDRTLNLLQNYIVIHYTVEPYPKLEDVDNLIIESMENRINLIIGIGGGSVLDTAKIISVMFNNEKSALDYDKEKINKKYLPFIAVPTTAGTGSEVTPFAVFYQNKRKKSFGGVKHSIVFPDYAIVDPELTITMNKELIASTGLDAFSQALESYWSVHSNALSDVHSLEAIKLIMRNLENSYLHDDINYKVNMARASLESGLAFSQTATTAPHSVSYPMTAHFNLKHGFACALTLPEFLFYNYTVKDSDCTDRRGSDFVAERLEDLSRKINFNSVLEFYHRIKDLMFNIRAPLTLKDANINDINIIIDEGFSPERMSNNPRLVTSDSLRSLLLNILK